MITEITEAQAGRFQEFVDKWVSRAFAPDDLTDSQIEAIVERFDKEVLGVGGRVIRVESSPLAAWKAVCEIEDGLKLNEFTWPYADGQFSAYYFAWVDYMREVLGVIITVPLEAYEATLQVGPMWPLEKCIVVSRKSNSVSRNDAKQLHRDGGPAVEYRDGNSVWCLNGVRVSQHIAETRAELLDPKLALAENNVEIRREIIRKVGIERLLQVTDHKVLDTWGEYKLLELRLSEEVPAAKYLKMTNPSLGVYHVEGVSDECRTVKAALNFRKPEAMKAIPVSEDGEAWFQQGDVCVWPADAKTLKELPDKLT